MGCYSTFCNLDIAVIVNENFTTVNIPSLTAANGSAIEPLGSVTGPSAVGGDAGPAGTRDSSAAALSFSSSAAGAGAAAVVVSNTAGFIPNGSTPPTDAAESVEDAAACGGDLAVTDDGGCIAGTFVTPAGGLDVGLGSAAGAFSAGDSDDGCFCCFLYDGGTMSAGRLAGTGLPDLAMAT